MYNATKQYSLMKTTLSLLNSDERSLLDVANSTGISWYWLRKFAQGEVADPSVNRVQALYEFLTGKKLPV